jgi:hypothetical protein
MAIAKLKVVKRLRILLHFSYLVETLVEFW